MIPPFNATRPRNDREDYFCTNVFILPVGVCRATSERSLNTRRILCKSCFIGHRPGGSGADSSENEQSGTAAD